MKHRNKQRLFISIMAGFMAVVMLLPMLANIFAGR